MKAKPPTTAELYAFARKRIRECKAAGESYRVYICDAWMFRSFLRRAAGAQR